MIEWPENIRKIAADCAAGKGFEGTVKDLRANMDLDDPQNEQCLNEALEYISKVIDKIDFWDMYNKLYSRTAIRD
jgi:hypothetical protein